MAKINDNLSVTIMITNSAEFNALVDKVAEIKKQLDEAIAELNKFEFNVEVAK